jgi:hypothetical protein
MKVSILDADTLGMAAIAVRLPSDEKERIKRQIADRIVQIKAGVNRYPQIDEALQLAFKDNLRTRLDFNKPSTPLIIERYSADAGCWLFIMEWPHEHNGNPWTIEQVIAKLHESDTRRFHSVADYIQHKNEMSAKIRSENMRRANDALLSVIDQMGTKRIKNFIEVERAIVTGEKITAHGADLRSFERMHAASIRHESKLIPALKRGADFAQKLGLNVVGVDDEYNPVYTDGEPLKPTIAINPGHHPKVHKRVKRERSQP